MILQNSPSRAELASTTSTREGALLIGCDSKTHLGSSTTVEAALTALDARAVQYVDLAAAGPGILFQASLGAPITVVASGVSATELGYLDGVTAPIQTQIDGKLSLSGGTLTGALTLNADPSNSLHPATKQYVDALVNGVKWKVSVRVATTANGTLASAFVNGTVHDGVTLVTGDRILIKNQLTASENGIQIVPASGAPTRASDADSFGELNGAVVMVLEGTANGDKGFMQIAELTSLSDNQTWIQNFGTGLFVADESTLTLSGSTFSVKALGITNAQVSASAAIAHSKMASLTASRALVSDGSGFTSVSAVTSTELALLSGVTGTLVTTAASQTLTNKTLTSPRVETAILDTNGNELLALAATASAINELTITNAASGTNPTISATGGNSSIGINYIAKGNGVHTFLNALFQAPITLTYAATVNINWALANYFEILLTGPVTFTYSNFATGSCILLRVQQDGAGNRAITYPTVTTNFVGGTNTLATAGNHIDWLLIVCRAGPTFDVIRFGPDLF